MKRLFTIIALALAIATGANAQRAQFGVKGGVNLSDFSIDKKSWDKAIDTKNHAGFFIGPTLRYDVGLLGFDLAALYNQQKVEIAGEKITSKYINIPINLRLNIGLGQTLGVFAAAGPQFAFNVGDTDFSFSGIKNQVKEYTLRSSTLSMNFGAGVKLLSHLEAGIYYNVPIGKTGEITPGDAAKAAIDEATGKSDTKTGSWSISAALYF